MKEFIEKLIGRLEELRIDKSNYFGVLNIVAEKYDRANEMLDDAIEIAKELAEEYIPCTKPCTDCEAYDLVKHNCPKFCKVIKETVEELAEEYNNGWIPCSERLPDNDNEVLCWYEYRIMQGTCISEMAHRYGIGWYSKKSDIWVGEVSVGVDCKVIAWQPLPQPYAEHKQPIWKQQTMNRFERLE